MNSIDDNATEQWSSSTYEVGGKSVIRKNAVVKKQVMKSVKLIDETEQDIIIENLIKDAYRQGNNARTAFHYLFLILSGIFSLCLFYSFSHPFKMDHQKYFMDIIPLWGFHVFYIVTIATFMASATVVKFGKKLQGRKKSFLTNIPFLIGLIMGSLSAAFWLIVICNSEIYRKELTMEFFVHCAWLPFANITSILIATYVDRDANHLLQEIYEMEGKKYTYKEI